MLAAGRAGAAAWAGAGGGSEWMVGTGQRGDPQEPLRAGLVRGEGPKALRGGVTAAMVDREQPTPPASEMGRRLAPEALLALPLQVAPGVTATGLSDEAGLLHVRGYLPVWAGPGHRYARLDVSKSGRLLASLRFDLRTFISLGRSADKVRPLATSVAPSPLPAPQATRRSGYHRARWTRGRSHAPGRSPPHTCGEWGGCGRSGGNLRARGVPAVLGRPVRSPASPSGAGGGRGRVPPHALVCAERDGGRAGCGVFLGA